MHEADTESVHSVLQIYLSQSPLTKLLSCFFSAQSGAKTQSMSSGHESKFSVLELMHPSTSTCTGSSARHVKPSGKPNFSSEHSLPLAVSKSQISFQSEHGARLPEQEVPVWESRKAERVVERHESTNWLLE